MSEEKNHPIKTVTDSIYKWIGTGLCLLFFGGVAFYYGTQAELAEHERAITDLQTKIGQMVTQAELKDYKDLVREDMRIIHEDIKEVRNDNKKILEILSEQQR